MSFKNLSITTKIGVIFGVVLIISIVNVSYIYFSKNKNSGTLIDVAGRNRMLSQRLAFYSSISQQPDDTCFSTMKQLCDLHDQSITVMKKGGIAPGIDNNKVVENIETLFPSEFMKIDQVWTPFRNSVNKLISSNSREEIENEKKQIINLANPLLNANNDLVISIVQWNKATESHINKILTILTILNLLTIIVAFFILSNYVVKPLRKILPAFMDIANGIIGQKFESGNKDEVGLLIDAFNKMNDNLEKIIKEITVGADQIVTGSEQISQASQILSTGAQQQAASTEEVSAAIEEMVASIEQNTENSLQTNSISNNAMQGMREMVKSSQDSMNAIRTITDKIKIINEIAFQTNMLALNAAVEAARAGEHGKGFAVVAAEVRKLAERSKSAANEIGEISSNSIQTIEKTKDIAITLLPQVEKTAILVQEIAAAGKEQTSGASQINLAVQQMSHVIEQNAASSEELATSSEEFASQAEMLKETISFFRIIDENHNKNRELITWGPKYCIGINTIDDQHKVLVDLINKLYVSFGEEGLKKQQKIIISELVDYTVYHFGNEEKCSRKLVTKNCLHTKSLM